MGSRVDPPPLYGYVTSSHCSPPCVSKTLRITANAVIPGNSPSAGIYILNGRLAAKVGVASRSYDGLTISEGVRGADSISRLLCGDCGERLLCTGLQEVREAHVVSDG